MPYQLTTAKIWDGAAWVDAVGGTLTVDYLIVAGGGGSITDNGTGQTGGGGAGGYISSVTGENTGGGLSAVPKLSLTPGAYTLTVGAGGAANVTNGSNSIFGNIVAIGGGHGGNLAGSSVGFGGSGGGTNNNKEPGAGLSGQGFRGGTSANNGSGGGGGAGGAGVDSNAGTNGGEGVASSITGSSVTRAGGGNGGDTSSPAPAGGTERNTAGAPNSGAGAGGCNADNGGFAGGSGVIFFAISSSASVSFSAGVTATSALVGINRVYTVTAAGPTDTVTIG